MSCLLLGNFERIGFIIIRPCCITKQKNTTQSNTDGLVQDCSNSSALAMESLQSCSRPSHDDVIKWKHFPCYQPFVLGIHQSPVNSSHKGQWHGALMFSLICARINGWVNNHEAGDLRRHHSHHDVTVMNIQYFMGEHNPIWRLGPRLQYLHY